MYNLPDDVDYEWEMLRKSDVIGYVTALQAIREQRSELNNWSFLLKGTEFSCSFPTTLSEKEDAVQTDVGSPGEVLAPLRHNCLYKRESWWSYEFCFGKSIRQFHLEGEKVAAEYYLGYASTLAGVENEKYYSETYTDGTACDVNGARRSSTVNYYCNPSVSAHQIVSFQEPSLCRYIIEIEGPLLCQHPKYYIPVVASEKIYCFEAPLMTNEEIATCDLTPEQPQAMRQPSFVPEKAKEFVAPSKTLQDLLRKKDIVFTVVDQNGNELIDLKKILADMDEEQEDNGDNL